MTTIKTDPGLLKQLYAAASRPISAHEMELQCLSFVMGMLSHKNTLTREAVKKIIDRQNGKEAVDGSV